MSDDGWLERQARAGARRRRWSSWLERRRDAHPKPEPARLSPAEARIENALRSRLGRGAGPAILLAILGVSTAAPVIVFKLRGVEPSFGVFFGTALALSTIGLLAFIRFNSSAAHARSQRDWLRALPFSLTGYPSVLGSDHAHCRLQVRVQFASAPVEVNERAILDAGSGALGARLEGSRFEAGALVLTSRRFECRVDPEDGDPFIDNGPLHVWTRAVLRRFLLPLHRRFPLRDASFRAIPD